MNFASDNVVGASPPVLDALVRANQGPAAAYGEDALTRAVERRFADLFEREVAVFLVATGTAANALALSGPVAPWGLCLCHEEAHVIDDECGAPEFFTHGAKLQGLPGIGCKLDPGKVAGFIDALPSSVKQMPAQALSISQATESGLVYRPDEIAAFGEMCRGRNLKLHMDGARFANALVSLDASPAEMTWRSGIDILSFGATKNGCLAAEAVVAFDPALADTLAFRRKRAGHTLSKGRFLAAQFEGYLADGHWLDNARCANRAAQRLSAGLARLPGVRLAWPTQANEVFAILPKTIDRALKAAGASYHPWSARSLGPDGRMCADDVLARFVTSFATSDSDVDRLLAAAGSAETPGQGFMDKG